jgi:hypothetical protein
VTARPWLVFDSPEPSLRDGQATVRKPRGAYQDFLNLVVYLANCYEGPILPVIALRSELSLTFRNAPVAVKRSKPRNALRWGSTE